MAPNTFKHIFGGKPTRNGINFRFLFRKQTHNLKQTCVISVRVFVTNHVTNRFFSGLNRCSLAYREIFSNASL